MTMEDWMVSPRYNMQSLHEGKITPVDVFEDAIQGWILDYARKLAQLNERAAGVAIIVLVAACPETIECYLTGEDSKNASRRFFTNGMKRIFPEVADVPADALNSVCDDLRNGLYHGSMLKGSVVLVPDGPAVTYSVDERVFTINPFAFFERIQQHFTNYVGRLRTGKPDDQEVMNFNRYWETRHFRTAEPLPVNARPVLDLDQIVTSTAAPSLPYYGVALRTTTPTQATRALTNGKRQDSNLNNERSKTFT
jgi:hypothetical protein